MKFKTVSLVVCGFLFVSLAAGTISSASSTPVTSSILENISLDLLLEFKSTGRFRIKADYSGPNPLLYYVAGAVVAPKAPPPSMVSVGLDNNVPGSSGLLLMHYGGDTIAGAITQGRLENLELRINGEVVVPTAIYLNGEIVTGDKDFMVGDVIKLEGGYQLSSGDVIEIRAAGSLLIKTQVGSTSFAARSASPGYGSVSASPAQSVSWNINIELSSPSEGTLTITANGWAVLPLTEEQKQRVSLAVAGYKLAPETFNQQALQQIQSQLRYIDDLEITNLNVAQLDWDGAGSKLTFSVTVTARSLKFKAELQKELPMSIYTTGTGSTPTAIRSEEDLEGLTLDIMFRLISQTTTAELRANFAGLICTIGVDWEFDLPQTETGVVTRSDNIIVVDFSKMREYWPAYITIPEVQAHENVRFTLRVPAGAEVENLPSGYTQADSTYTWTGTSAAEAILALITGEASTRISYWIGPATVTVENIQTSVGQTVEVENQYVTSVEVESKRVISVEFEKDQPIRKLRVTLATAVNNIDVQAQRLPEKPAEVTEPPAEKGIVCHYLEMKTAVPEQVESAIIEFRVPKLWISVNNIDQATVRLLRYQGGGWTELETTEIGEDENNVYFSAGTPGFSVFAITAQAQLPTVPTTPLPPLEVIIVVALALVVVLVLVMWRYLSR